LKRGRLRFAQGHAYIRGMDDLSYWTNKLREAEAKLDAAKTRSQVDEAASGYQRAKAELRALEQSAKTAKRRTSRGSRSAAASS
jgi:hypothetical protein